MGSIGGYIGWALFAILKFVVTPSGMILNDYSLLETIITTSSGAVIGVTIFYFSGERIINGINSLIDKVIKARKKRVFTRGNRFIVWMKNSNGIFGLALISVILSVPITGILAGKYFRDSPRTLPILYIAFTTWAIILTLATGAIKSI